MQGHKNAVLEVQWMPSGERIISCSADKTVRAWDVEAGQQVKKTTEHDNFVNSVCPARRGPPLFVSGADDSTVKVWDMRIKRSIKTFHDKFQVTAVAFADAGDQVYSGGLDNTVKVPFSICIVGTFHMSMEMHDHGMFRASAEYMEQPPLTCCSRSTCMAAASCNHFLTLCLAVHILQSRKYV